jgi:acetyl-CoA acetyltransferase
VICVVGVGQSDYSKRSGRSAQALAADAAWDALADAGLTAAEVDGVIPLGGSVFTEDLIAGLGLSDGVFDATPAPGGNAAVSSLAVAEALIHGGRASVVLISFARNGASGNRIRQRIGLLPGGQFRTQLEASQGWDVPAAWYATICRRHMLEFGTTKKHLAAVALQARSNAALNPRAMLRGRPLTYSDYTAAPMIADPYQLYDCCLETDGAAVVIVADAEHARETRRAVDIRATASARPQSPDDLTNRTDWMRIGLDAAAPAAFEMAGLGPDNMDAAMIYDCFTFEVIHQLEAAGFCAPGEGGPFVASGAIGASGRLPVNTHGGLLAEGHLGGLNHVIEAVVQLRGEAGQRQLARPRFIAVSGWGDLGDGSMSVLAAQR